MIDKLPCVNCICLAMCKQKYLKIMFDDCKLITRYWRVVNLHPQDEGAREALSVSQALNHYLNREFMPSYINTMKGQKFGLIDVSLERHAHQNIKDIIRSFKHYYLNHEINLLKFETIGERLDIILDKRKPFLWMKPSDQNTIEGLDN